MLQFFSECLLWVNLPWTILLLLAGAYWLVTSFGAVEMRGLDPEISDELRLGTRGGSPAPPDRRGLAGVVSSFLKFVHYGQAPLIFIVTIGSGAGFLFSLVGNFFLGMDEHIAAGLAWLFLSFLVAVSVVYVSVRPIAGFFRRRTPKYEARETREVIGQRCAVSSLELTEREGQVEIKKLRGAPLIVEARTAPGQAALRKGDTAFVVSYDKDRQVYQVSATDPAAPFDYSASEAELVTSKVS
jgi:hypothetical protein